MCSLVSSFSFGIRSPKDHSEGVLLPQVPQHTHNLTVHSLIAVTSRLAFGLRLLGPQALYRDHADESITRRVVLFY